MYFCLVLFAKNFSLASSICCFFSFSDSFRSHRVRNLDKTLYLSILTETYSHSRSALCFFAISLQSLRNALLVKLVSFALCLSSQSLNRRLLRMIRFMPLKVNAKSSFESCLFFALVNSLTAHCKLVYLWKAKKTLRSFST